MLTDGVMLVRGVFDLEVRRGPQVFAAGAVISFGLMDIQYCPGSACSALWSWIGSDGGDSSSISRPFPACRAFYICGKCCRDGRATVRADTSAKACMKQVGGPGWGAAS